MHRAWEEARPEKVAEHRRGGPGVWHAARRRRRRKGSQVGVTKTNEVSGMDVWKVGTAGTAGTAGVRRGSGCRCGDSTEKPAAKWGPGVLSVVWLVFKWDRSQHGAC